MNRTVERLSRLDQPIRIGIVGIGSIGRGMVLQAGLTPGIECVAIADIELDRARGWAEALGRSYEVVESPRQMNDAIRRGRLAISADGELVARAEPLDLVIEATSSTVAGGRHGLAALESDKHLVMMNYEADLMFGPYLMRLADDRGRVYTVCDGDQPAVLRRLVDEIEFMGFRLVMAGNIKGYLDRYVDPTSIRPEADKRNLDYRMCTSYTDGTKLGVEMAVLANGLGLRAAVPGMLGPRVDDIHRVFEVFDLDDLWDGSTGLVDYVLGARPRGGVFVIAHTGIAHQQETLAWFPPDMGPGPFYLFYRPYHLGHFESMATVAAAALDGVAVLRPEQGFRTMVNAYAKRDLEAGARLDGVGGYACYGLIENMDDHPDEPGLPICLAENVTLRRAIPRDGRVRLGDVALDPSDAGVALHRLAVEATRGPGATTNGRAERSRGMG